MEKGKEYTIADDHGPQELLISEKEGVFISPAYSEMAVRKHKIFNKATHILQTQSGEFIVLASEKKVMVYCVKEQKAIAEREFNYIHSITLSSTEGILQILDKINVNEGRTILFSLPKLDQLIEFPEDQHTGYFKKQHFPLIKFNADDSRYFKYTNKIIQVYNLNHEKVTEVQSGFIQFFQVSKISKGDQFFLAVIFLDKKTNQGRCNIFTQTTINFPLYSKLIKKAEEVKIRFSPISNQFIMELQTYFDPSGKSYYGEFGLFIYSDTRNKIASIKSENGPVHDFSWDRTGKNFIVISGFMPASIKMFNYQNEPVFDFGKKHRNTIVWGNLGRFLCLAGFGNLNGQMQMWDLVDLKQIGYCKSSSASYCQWALDDRKIVTAIVTPRLRVDNCYRVFSYTGKELIKVGYEETQLYGAHWVKVPGFKGQPRELSPNRRIQIEKKQQGKFKSFAASLNFEGLTLNEKKDDKPKIVPGQFPGDQVKEKKKRKRKPKQVEELGPTDTNQG